jgi:hypothetical protein
MPVDQNNWADLSGLADPAELGRVRAALDDAARERFDLLWTRLREARGDVAPATTIAERLVQFLARQLPAWEYRRNRFTVEAGPAQLPQAVVVLSLLFPDADGAAPAPAQLQPQTPPPPPDSVAALQERARRELLAAVAEVDADLPERGPGPAPAGDPSPHLIRLTDRQGTKTVPGFQFSGAGTAAPVVLEINELLGAREDPWGVTAWWVRPNLWLAAAPARMIGAVADERLVAAARAALTGDW